MSGRDRRELERPEGCWSAPEVATEIGVNHTTVHRWVTAGRITPSGGRGVGSGCFSWFTPADVARLRLVVARLDWGMTLDAAFRVVDPPLPTLDQAATPCTSEA